TTLQVVELPQVAITAPPVVGSEGIQELPRLHTVWSQCSLRQRCQPFDAAMLLPPDVPHAAAWRGEYAHRGSQGWAWQSHAPGADAVCKARPESARHTAALGCTPG